MYNIVIDSVTIWVYLNLKTEVYKNKKKTNIKII